MNEVPIVWKVRPAATQPQKLTTLAVFAILAGVMGLVLTRKPVFFVIGALLVLASTADFWLGVTYRVDSRGVSRRVGFSETAMTWEQVRRAEVSDQELYLSPLESSGRRDAFRGVRIPLPDAHRDEVLRRVKASMQAAADARAT